MMEELLQKVKTYMLYLDTETQENLDGLAKVIIEEVSSQSNQRQLEKIKEWVNKMPTFTSESVGDQFLTVNPKPRKYATPGAISKSDFLDYLTSLEKEGV